MMRKYRSFLMGLLLLSLTAFILTLISCGEKVDLFRDSTATYRDTSDMLFWFTENDYDSRVIEVKATVEFSDDGIRVQGTGVSVSGNTVTVTKAGTFKFYGSCSDGCIVVDAAKGKTGDGDKVKLVLNGLDLTSKSGPALHIKEADKVFITLPKGKDNYLRDTEIHNDPLADATLFSMEDTTVNGLGSLTVEGNYRHGIVAKDDLVFTGGCVTIDAQKSGIEGKDCVKITGTQLVINAGSIGLRTKNADDDFRGYIFIKDGNISVDAGGDGIAAQSVIRIDGGSISVKNHAGESTPGKGIKAESDILISGGNITVNTPDDAINSNGCIRITGGDLNLMSLDDAIHSDAALHIGGGNITVPSCLEGFESAEIIIAGGNISIVSSDDGINAVGDAPGTAPMMEKDRFAHTYGKIIISGGNITVDAMGDGIDTNGILTVSGGYTVISGSSDGGFTAVDHNGTALVTGGTLIALSMGDYPQEFDVVHNQAAFCKSLLMCDGGSTLRILDVNGNELIAFTPAKAYDYILVTSPLLRDGESYTVTVDGETVSVLE